MDAAKCFDAVTVTVHNILMIEASRERDMDSEGGVPIQLRFEGSPDLKEVVGSLVKPELRREFARRSFYLYLRTPQPVELPLSFHDINSLERADHTVDAYYAHLAVQHKGRSVYASHLKLAPLMGHYEHPAPQRGTSLLFQLALEEYEKQQVTSPPFESLRSEDLHVTHYLKDSVMIAECKRPEIYETIKSVMGANNPAVRRRGYAYDSLYVVHPTIIQSPLKNRPANNHSA